LQDVVLQTLHCLWSPYGIGQTIIFSSCGFFLSSIFFFSSPYLSGRTLDVYHANLECRSEMCCTLLAEKTAGPKKVARNRHLGTIAHPCRAISSKPRHVSTIGKSLLNSNMSSRCPHNMLNIGPLTAEIFWRVLGTLANFNGFRVLAALLHGSQIVTDVSQTLQR